MRARRRVVASGVLALGSAAAVLLSASGAQAGTTQTVGDRTEAWYVIGTAAVCSSPLGCPPDALASTYPSGTLHVAVTAGQEQMRSYVVPALPVLPASGTVTGTLHLPVDTAAQDGSQSPQTAKLQACLVTTPVKSGYGLTGTPPTVDCKTAQSAVTYVAGASPELRVDLSPFLAAWQQGAAADGIAIEAAPTQSPGATWHVVIYGKQAAAKAKPRSDLTTTTAAATKPTSAPKPAPSASAAPPPASGNISVPPAGPPAAVGGTLPSAPGTAPSIAPSPVVAPPASTQPQQALAPAANRGFTYPAAMLLPLGFVVGLVFLVRTFTRDPAPRRIHVS